MTSNWEIVKAEDFCFTVTDGTHDSPKAKENGHYLITSKHLAPYNIDFSSAKKISEEDYQKVIKRSPVEQWDILFSMIGTIGITYIEKNTAIDYACKNMGIFKFNGDKNKAYWLYYYLQTPQAKEYILGHLRGTTQQYLPLGSLREFPIQVPSAEIRNNITSILRSLDDRIAVNTALNENLEQQAQTLFKAWFVDFEPFGGVMPDDWQIVPLGELCDSISKKHRFNKPELIFLNTGDVENGMVLHNNYSEVSQMPGQAKKSIAINDILYSEIRPINKHFTYVNFIADDYVVSTKLMVLRAKGISPRRLYQFLTMPDTLNELQHEAETRSGTFPQIRFDNIQQLEMIVASEQLENEYSERLNAIYSMIDSNNTENQRLAALRDTLLPKLMNGEIDVSAVSI